MYSLAPIVTQPAAPTTTSEQKLGNPKPDFITPPDAPKMWFNPGTQRWVSTSCRTYREILRDRALVLNGLPPGPRKKKRKTRQEYRPEPMKQEIAHTIPPMYNIHSSAFRLPEISLQQSCPEPQAVVPSRPLTDREKRDALFKKYGL